MRPVLVTGGHGFVGSHLVRRLLATGSTVRCLVRGTAVPEALKDLPVECVAGDLTRPESLARAVEGAGEVYHLAARLTASSRREMFETNARGTRSLVEAVVAAGNATRFVLCSSIAVCGPSNDGPPMREDAPLRPVTWYGASKALGERIVRAFGARGLPFTIVRPPIVYGPRDRGLLSVFEAAARGFKTLVGRQPKRYSWVFGPDLADALVALGRSEATRGGTYFACHPEVVSMGDFIDLALKGSGRRGFEVEVPDALLGMAAAGADLVAQVTGKPGMLTRDKMAELTAMAWVCSPREAERAAGWRAATPLSEGVPATVAWYRENGWIPVGPRPGAR